MDARSIYLISEVEGFSPQIGRLVSMMNYVRFTTFESVKGLTSRELDCLYERDSNSIGALLFHIASVEFVYRNGDLGRLKIKNNDLNYYIKLLEEVRLKTLELFRSRDDQWLDIESPFNNRPSNNYFRWFHVFEDELNHRGQIRIIVKKLRREKS